MTASPGTLLPIAFQAVDAAVDDLVSDVDLAIERAIRGYLEHASPTRRVPRRGRRPVRRPGARCYGSGGWPRVIVTGGRSGACRSNAASAESPC
jgi:hypothetical protein